MNILRRLVTTLSERKKTELVECYRVAVMALHADLLLTVTACSDAHDRLAEISRHDPPTVAKERSAQVASALRARRLTLSKAMRRARSAQHGCYRRYHRLRPELQQDIRRSSEAHETCRRESARYLDRLDQLHLTALYLARTGRIETVNEVLLSAFDQPEPRPATKPHTTWTPDTPTANLEVADISKSVWEAHRPRPPKDQQPDGATPASTGAQGLGRLTEA